MSKNKSGDQRKEKEKYRLLAIKSRAEVKDLESQLKFLTEYSLLNKVNIDELIAKKNRMVNSGKEEEEVKKWMHGVFQDNIHRYKNLMMGNISEKRNKKFLDDFDRERVENKRLKEIRDKVLPTTVGQYTYWKQKCQRSTDAHHDESNRLISLKALILDFESFVRKMGPIAKVEEDEEEGVVEQTDVDKLMKAYEILYKIKKEAPLAVGMEEEELERALAALMGNKDDVVKSDKEEVVKADNSYIKEKQSKPAYPPLPEEPEVADENILCRVGVCLPDGRRLERNFLLTDPIQLLWSFCSSQFSEGDSRPFGLTRAIRGASKSLDYAKNLTFAESGIANSMVWVTWE